MKSSLLKTDMIGNKKNGREDKISNLKNKKWEMAKH